MPNDSLDTASGRLAKPSLAGHIAIARFDHWVKNVFVLPGILIALSVAQLQDWTSFAIRVLLGLLSVGMVASSNYILNEVLDAPFDRWHPIKCRRPVPAGLVSIPIAYMQWLAFMAAGLALAACISWPFFLTMAALWIMGCLYNVPPIRLKDKPYLDVLSESINNPLRMLAGWYITFSALPPPASLLVSYWMIGCYFMAIKRYAEYREIGDPAVSAAYRRSFSYYNEQRLLVSITFYGSFAMLTFGGFVARYRLELIFAYPFIALVSALYFNMAFKKDSAAQAPERLYREPTLMVAVALCALITISLFFVQIPSLARIFTMVSSPILRQK
jgi:decaprenyl-phosphate phosphoribosyltransferase